MISANWNTTELAKKTAMLTMYLRTNLKALDQETLRLLDEVERELQELREE